MNDKIERPAQWPTPEPSINKLVPGFAEISNKEYHSIDAMSSSGIRDFMRVPAAYGAEKEFSNDQEDSFRLGSAVHCAVLENGEFDRRYVRMPDEIKVRNGGAWEEFKASENREILTRKQWETVHRMAEAWDHPRHAFAKRLIYQRGPVELSGIWEENGILCKCRPDKMFTPDVLADLKTAKDASPHGFGRSAVQLGYDIQAAWYCRGMTKITGRPHRHFIFIAQEKTPPYLIGVYPLPGDILDRAMHRIDVALVEFRRMREEDDFPGYFNGFNPNWWPT
jgi:exodeoxyribonuclease VIII